MSYMSVGLYATGTYEGILLKCSTVEKLLNLIETYYCGDTDRSDHDPLYVHSE